MWERGGDRQMDRSIEGCLALQPQWPFSHMTWNAPAGCPFCGGSHQARLPARYCSAWPAAVRMGWGSGVPVVGPAVPCPCLTEAARPWPGSLALLHLHFLICGCGVSLWYRVAVVFMQISTQQQVGESPMHTHPAGGCSSS